MKPRRHSTTRQVRETAGDGQKSLELETRIARLERHLRDTSQTLEIVLKRLTAIQAELDHLAARAGRS